MATFSITTTAKQDAAAQRMLQEYNTSFPNSQLTVLQFVRERINDVFNRWVDRFDQEDRESKATLYQRATPEDQATIDTILNKYR